MGLAEGPPVRCCSSSGARRSLASRAAPCTRSSTRGSSAWPARSGRRWRRAGEPRGPEGISWYRSPCTPRDDVSAATTRRSSSPWSPRVSWACPAGRRSCARGRPSRNTASTWTPGAERSRRVRGPGWCRTGAPRALGRAGGRHRHDGRHVGGLRGRVARRGGRGRERRDRGPRALRGAGAASSGLRGTLRCLSRAGGRAQAPPGSQHFTQSERQGTDRGVPWGIWAGRGTPAGHGRRPRRVDRA